MKPRPKIPLKTAKRLQKEINSNCPFCKNEEVEYFEIHHIDENPANNSEINLIMLCANCHTKITKGDISQIEVIRVKNALPLANNQVEFVSAVINSKLCSWEVSNENEYAFLRTEELKKYPFPIIDFTLINHSNKTIVLTKIILNVKFIPNISGIPQPRVLLPLTKYEIPIAGKKNVLNLENPIQIPANEAFMFQVELFKKLDDNEERYEIKDPMVLYFSFKFSNNIDIQIPDIFLNCKSDKSSIYILS